MKRSFLLLIPVLLLAACGGNSEPSPTASSSAPQLANPASVYCESVGGTVEMVTTADGQQGMCNLPDGTVIDEWELYRSANPTPSE